MVYPPWSARRNRAGRKLTRLRNVAPLTGGGSPAHTHATWPRRRGRAGPAPPRPPLRAPGHGQRLRVARPPVAGLDARRRPRAAAAATPPDCLDLVGGDAEAPAQGVTPGVEHAARANTFTSASWAASSASGAAGRVAGEAAQQEYRQTKTVERLAVAVGETCGRSRCRASRRARSTRTNLPAAARRAETAAAPDRHHGPGPRVRRRGPRAADGQGDLFASAVSTSSDLLRRATARRAGDRARARCGRVTAGSGCTLLQVRQDLARRVRAPDRPSRRRPGARPRRRGTGRQRDAR